MRIRIFIPLLLFSSAALLSAQESLLRLVPKSAFTGDKSEVEAIALFSAPSPTGFLPVRIQAVNQRQTTADFRISSTSQVGSDSELTSSLSFQVPAESTYSQDFLIPLATALPESSEISSGVELQLSGSFGRLSGNLGSAWSYKAPAVLLSDSLFTANRGELDKSLNGSATGYRNYEFAASFDPKRTPEAWKAYSGYDCLILTDSEWTTLPSGARSSILEWCRLGGRLEILRVGTSPATFDSLGIDAQGEADLRDFGFGKVKLGQVPADLRVDAPTLVTSLIAAGRPKIETLDEDYSYVWPLHQHFGGRAFNYGIFVVVLIVFGVLVGPVNLFVLAKSGRRHRLFITTPIISLATCALLLALILLRDGTGGRGERIALVEVRPDGNENRAYVHQEQVSRTGVLFGSSFSLEEEAVVSPVPLGDGPWTRLHADEGGAGFQYQVSPGDRGMTQSGDWFQSRSEQGQIIEAVVPTRGRIELRSADEAPRLVSTFDFPIEKIYYKDRSNALWTAGPLGAGKAQDMTPMTEAEWDSALDAQSKLLGARHKAMLITASKRADHFFAVTREAPGIETFKSIRWQETTTLITGPVVR